MLCRSFSEGWGVQGKFLTTGFDDFTAKLNEKEGFVIFVAVIGLVNYVLGI